MKKNEKDFSQNIDDNYLIKCERINLKYCNLDFVPQDKVGFEKFTYSMTLRVFEKLLLSELQVRVVNFFPENNQFAQVLSYNLVGIFTTDHKVSQEKFGDFGKHFTFSILWPYAREFAQDIFSRTGFSWDCLPIINAQDTTKKMIESGSITVQYQSPSEA